MLAFKPKDKTLFIAGDNITSEICEDSFSIPSGFNVKRNEHHFIIQYKNNLCGILDFHSWKNGESLYRSYALKNFSSKLTMDDIFRLTPNAKDLISLNSQLDPDPFPHSIQLLCEWAANHPSQIQTSTV